MRTSDLVVTSVLLLTLGSCDKKGETASPDAAPAEEAAAPSAMEPTPAPEPLVEEEDESMGEDAMPEEEEDEGEEEDETGG